MKIQDSSAKSGFFKTILILSCLFAGYQGLKKFSLDKIPGEREGGGLWSLGRILGKGKRRTQEPTGSQKAGRRGDPPSWGERDCQISKLVISVRCFNLVFVFLLLTFLLHLSYLCNVYMLGFGGLGLLWLSKAAWNIEFVDDIVPLLAIVIKWWGMAWIEHWWI